MEKAGFTEDRLNTLDHDDLGSSPFSEEVRLYDPPEKFSVPRFVLYDGTTDPASHLQHFTQRMSVWGDRDNLLCNVFSSSLGDLPLKWFCGLSPGSIQNWKQLRSSFIAKFQAHRTIPKSNEDIMTMRMKDSENVTQFAKRFWTTFSEVENGDEGIAIKSFKQGLLPGNDLRKDLVRFPVNSISALMS